MLMDYLDAGILTAGSESPPYLPTLPADTGRKTDSQRIPHCADDFDLGGLGPFVVEHRGATRTDELASIVNALSSDDRQGFVDFLEIDLLGRQQGRVKSREAKHDSTESIGPRLRFSGFARSPDHGSENEPVGVGEVAGATGWILLAGKITPHRRLNEQDDEAILGFVADLRDGLPEKILLLRRELT